MTKSNAPSAHAVVQELLTDKTYELSIRGDAGDLHPFGLAKWNQKVGSITLLRDGENVTLPIPVFLALADEIRATIDPESRLK